MPISFGNDAYMPVRSVKYQNEDVNVEIDSLTDPKVQKVIAQVTPDSNPPQNPFDGTSSSVFTISSDRVQIIEDCVLQMNVRESGGSQSITFLVTPYMFNRIEVQVNGAVWSTILRHNKAVRIYGTMTHTGHIHTSFI